MKFIGLGSISFSTFYPIFATLCYLSRSYILMFNSNPENFHRLFQILLIFIGETFCGILYLIIKRSLQPERISQPNQENESRQSLTTYKLVHFSKGNKMKSIKIYLIICGISLIDVISLILIEVFSSLQEKEQINNIESEMRITEFIFVIIFGYIFFKFKLHRHHYLALVLIIAGILTVAIPNLNFPIASLYLLLANLLYSIMELTEKWLMDIQYISVYKLIFIEGCFGLVLISIVIVIGSLMSCGDWIRSICKNESHIINFIDVIKNTFTEPVGIFTMLGYSISSCGYNIFIDLINKKNGPTHRVVSDTLSSFVNSFVIILMKDKFKFPIHEVFGYIFIIFGSLIFNEIIILFFCKLEVNTSNEIIERERAEISNITDDSHLDLFEESHNFEKSL